MRSWLSWLSTRRTATPADPFDALLELVADLDTPADALAPAFRAVASPRLSSTVAAKLGRALRDRGEHLADVAHLVGRDPATAWAALDGALHSWSRDLDTDLDALVTNPLLWKLEDAQVLWSRNVWTILAYDDAHVVSEWLARTGLARRADASDVLVLLESLVLDATRTSVAAAATELTLWCRALGLDHTTPWPPLAARALHSPADSTGPFQAFCHASHVEHTAIVAALVRAGVPGNLNELAELAASV